MTELKTLKDFKATEWNSEHTKKFEDWVKISELKAEAIKWIKMFEDSNAPWELKAEFISPEDYGEVVCWIKHFFNITKEKIDNGQ